MTDKPTDAELVARNLRWLSGSSDLAEGTKDTLLRGAAFIEQLSAEVRTLRNRGVTAQERIEQLSAQVAALREALTIARAFIAGTDDGDRFSVLDDIDTIAVLQTKEGGEPHNTGQPVSDSPDIATPTRPDAGPGGELALKVGDRVQGMNGFAGTVLAVYGGFAWIRYDANTTLGLATFDVSFLRPAAPSPPALETK